MALSDLIAGLRVDLGDEDQALFEEATLARCLLGSAWRLARDLDATYSVANGEIVPEPEGEARELLLLLARMHACQVMRSATASGFSFASGDKRVDKTKQAGRWAELEADLRAQYRSRLAEIRPEAALERDDYFLRPGALRPVIYEQGADLPWSC